ncbi:MAG: formate dehydrogenase subunit alpha [Polyangiaceae bacterium UTPRO1]|nr:formate dehydrogenase subunit alpha [Myxococcales bacterium]OQY66556.1 MAG: formate dehydrogenase subunit alpha [Polyangiaceae bacterium UTPRO1]
MTPTTCPFCAVGCGLVLDVAAKRVVAVTPDPVHPVSRGQLCAKGWNAGPFLASPERLRQPLLRRNGRLQPAAWSTALAAAAEALAAARAEGGADAVGVIASARATNEDAFAAMKFARAVLGTNNVDHCARVCHAPSVAGLRRTLGSGAMTNPIADLDEADCLFVVGADVTENHTIIGGRILAAHERGIPLVVVDPRRTRLARAADLHVQLRLGTDIALVNGMLHAIFAHGWEDGAYLAARCENVAALQASVADWTPDAAARVTGVTAATIVAAARLYATSRRGWLAYGLGVTQHVSGTETVIALSNLALVTGNVGVIGGGVNPLRGQNNVQGACDMGALPDVYSGYQAVADENARRRFETAWGVALPTAPGRTSLAMQHAAHDGELKALVVIGQDPAVTDPGGRFVARVLERLDCLIVAELFLTETAKLADIVLPAASFAEKDGTFTSTERRVQRVRRALAPPGEARADWQILDALAARLGRPLGFRDAAGIFAEMAALTPSYAGMSYARLEARGGLCWPCPTPTHPGTPRLHVEGCVRGRGRLIPVVHTPPAELPDADYPLQLTTFRLHHQYGSGSMTRRAPLLERENPRGLVWMHASDAARRRIATGAAVRVRSRRGEVTTRAVVSDDVPPGVVAMPYHFAEASPNLVTNDALDPIARMPELKVCAVAVEAC